MSLRNRTGIFGGTFNPLHLAHIHVAQRALDQYELSEVVFVPSGTPPHKEVADGVSREDRYEMVRRTIAPFDRLSLSRVEMDRAGPSYTIDTIEEMKGRFPKGICFIVGADLLLEIDTWKDPGLLLESVPFVIAPRDEIGREAFLCSPFDSAEIHFLDMEEVDLSSTWVREKVRRGEDLLQSVPAEVAKYINEHKLYQTGKLTKIGERDRR